MSQQSPIEFDDPAPTTNDDSPLSNDDTTEQLLQITKEAADKAREIGVNYRQETFAHLVANNKPATRAYQLAGYECQEYDTAAVRASELVRNIKVSQLIDWIRQQKLSAHTFSRDAKRRLLYKIGNESAQDANKLRAIEIDNRMTGDDAPVRIEGELTLTGILEGVKPSLGLPDGDVTDV